jgi:hypothetical protein
MYVSWGSEQDWEEYDSEEESWENMEKKALRSLCRDLMEEILDKSSFPLNSELDDFSRKGKSHAKSCLSKTCKIRRVKFSKKRYQMKGNFWNSIGLSDLAKTRFLRETSKEQNLAFISLLETGKKDFFPKNH